VRRDGHCFCALARPHNLRCLSKERIDPQSDRPQYANSILIGHSTEALQGVVKFAEQLKRVLHVLRVRGQ
jgi:hypothetical protein